MKTTRPFHHVVTVVCCLVFTLALEACGEMNRSDSTDVTPAVREDIISEAVAERHPTIAEAVNEAIEECEMAGQAAVDDLHACLILQSGEMLEDALLACTPDPPTCDAW